MDPLLPELWKQILEWALCLPWPKRRARTNIVEQLRWVCKDWAAWLHPIAVHLFKDLRRRAVEVDCECKMRYPRMLLQLQAEMRTFCCRWGMQPWQVLCYVEPSWRTELINPEMVGKIRNSLCIRPSPSRHRRRPQYLCQELNSMRKVDDDANELILGPWLFRDSDVPWNAFLVSLFVFSTRPRDLAACSEHAMSHFLKTWGLSSNGVLEKALSSYYSNDSYLEPRFQRDPSVVVAVNLLYEKYPCVQDYVVTLASVIPDRIIYPRPSWKDLIRDPVALSKGDAAALYSFVKRFCGEYPFLWDEELKERFRKALY